MVTGASALLIASVVLTFMYLGLRSAGNTAEMLFGADTLWYAPLHISYSVGVEWDLSSHAVTRPRLLYSPGHSPHGVSTFDQRIFPLIYPCSLWECSDSLYPSSLFHHVHVLRNCTDSDVLADWCMG